MEEKTPSTTLNLGLPKQRSRPQDTVSTELTLWDPTWPTATTISYNNKKREAEQLPKPSCADHHSHQTNPSKREKLLVSLTSQCDANHDEMINAMKKKRVEHKKKKIKITVGRLNQLDGWGIKKTLTAGDVLGDLHVPTSMITNHVLPYVDDKFSKAVVSRFGAQVVVYDCDTDFGYTRSISKQCRIRGNGTNTNTNTSTSYVFMEDKWHQGFVRRRQLKEGDEVGLHWLRLWPNPKPIFIFSLRKQRASKPPPASSPSIGL